MQKELTKKEAIKLISLTGVLETNKFNFFHLMNYEGFGGVYAVSRVIDGYNYRSGTFDFSKDESFTYKNRVDVLEARFINLVNSVYKSLILFSCNYRLGNIDTPEQIFFNIQRQNQTLVYSDGLSITLYHDSLDLSINGFLINHTDLNPYGQTTEQSLKLAKSIVELSFRELEEIACIILKRLQKKYKKLFI